jgi:SAM-dependent methyltransferase
MRDVARLARVLKTHGLAAALIKALGRAAGRRVHLYPDDAQAYLRETARVLREGGIAVVSFHDRPRGREAFSGDEHRADYDVAHFGSLCAQAGLALAENVGDVCGQRTFVLRKAAMAQ